MKKGNTLAEIMIVIAIVGVIMGFIVPIVLSVNNDANAKLYYAAYKTLMKAVYQINTRTGGLGIDYNSLPFDNTFCNIISDKMNTVGSVNCTSSSYPDNPNFKTINGMKWYGLNGTFYASKVVTVDVNGDKSPNKDDSDKLDLRVYWDKSVVPEGTLETSLINPSDLILECNKGLDLGFCQTAMYLGYNQNCNQIKTVWPNALSGVYKITPYGANGNETNTYCDMNTDGGGWTLVLNYLHKGYTSPALSAKKSLPVLGSSDVSGSGIDESSNSTTWGHASNQAMNSIDYDSTRFYCKTSAHSRIMHFKTSACNTYFRTGIGSCTSDIPSNSTTLTSASAYLPAATDAYSTNNGDFSMTTEPFRKASAYHWDLAVTESTHYNRWECDDFIKDNSKNTYHQIWVKGLSANIDGNYADSTIKQCNLDTFNSLTASSTSCTTAYNNNWNKSCSQIKTAWRSAPDGYYALTINGASSRIITFCDMTTNGGGYTLLVSSQADNLSGNGEVSRIIRNSNFNYLSIDITKALANLSSTVRISDYLYPSVFMESVTTYPILQLRAGNDLNDNANKTNAKINWTGPMANDTLLNYTTDYKSTYPYNIYWPKGNTTNGLKFYNFVGHSYYWPPTNADKSASLELWLKGPIN